MFSWKQNLKQPVSLPHPPNKWPKNLIRPTVVWMILFLGATAILFSRNIVGALKVMRNPAGVEGRVVDLLARDHRTVLVAYEVNGKRYTTSTSLPEQLALPAFQNLNIGDKVRVEYNPDSPSYGIPGSAEKLLLEDAKDIVGIGMFLVLVAALLEFRLRWYMRRRVTHS